MQHVRLWTLFAAVVLMCSDSYAQTRTSTPQSSSIVFVCEHGSAKSVIAANIFNKIAAERGLPVRAIARGLKPDAEVPERVVAALSAEGFDVTGFAPTRATDQELSSATRVVGIGIEGSDLGSERTDIQMWSHMPSSVDYGAFRKDLLNRIDELLLSLRPQVDTAKASADVEK